MLNTRSPLLAALVLPLVLAACAETGAPPSAQRQEAQRSEAERREAYRKANEAAESERRAKAPPQDPERAARSAAREASRKETCGDDYHAPRIGMTLERAMQCLGALRVATQVSRSGGILTTYVGADLYLEEFGGKIIGWGTR